jgi:uncharacterized spore protein YtfJ
MELEDIFKAIEDLREKGSVQAVYGEPVTVGDKTVIPVADVKYGFRLGYEEGPEAEAEAEAGGQASGGISSRPVAVLEITPEGVQVQPLMDENRIAMLGMFTGIWSIFWVAKSILAIFKR